MDYRGSQAGWWTESCKLPHCLDEEDDSDCENSISDSRYGQDYVYSNKNSRGCSCSDEAFKRRVSDNLYDADGIINGLVWLAWIALIIWFIPGCQAAQSHCLKDVAVESKSCNADNVFYGAKLNWADFNKKAVSRRMHLRDLYHKCDYPTSLHKNPESMECSQRNSEVMKRTARSAFRASGTTAGVGFIMATYTNNCNVKAGNTSIMECKPQTDIVTEMTPYNGRCHAIELEDATGSKSSIFGKIEGRLCFVESRTEYDTSYRYHTFSHTIKSGTNMNRGPAHAMYNWPSPSNGFSKCAGIEEYWEKLGGADTHCGGVTHRMYGINKGAGAVTDCWHTYQPQNVHQVGMVYDIGKPTPYMKVRLEFPAIDIDIEIEASRLQDRVCEKGVCLTLNNIRHNHPIQGRTIMGLFQDSSSSYTNKLYNNIPGRNNFGAHLAVHYFGFPVSDLCLGAHDYKSPTDVSATAAKGCRANYATSSISPADLDNSYQRVEAVGGTYYLQINKDHFSDRDWCTCWITVGNGDPSRYIGKGWFPKGGWSTSKCSDCENEWGGRSPFGAYGFPNWAFECSTGKNSNPGFFGKVPHRTFGASLFELNSESSTVGIRLEFDQVVNINITTELLNIKQLSCTVNGTLETLAGIELIFINNEPSQNFGALPTPHQTSDIIFVHGGIQSPGNMEVGGTIHATSLPPYKIVFDDGILECEDLGVHNTNDPVAEEEHGDYAQTEPTANDDWLIKFLDIMKIVGWVVLALALIVGFFYLLKFLIPMCKSLGTRSAKGSANLVALPTVSTGQYTSQQVYSPQPIYVPPTVQSPTVAASSQSPSLTPAELQTYQGYGGHPKST